MNKTCKQCGRDLPVDRFRKYAARGRGVYNTTQGYNTICLDCESISRRADRALKKDDAELIEKLRNHYQILNDRGLPPVTAPARKLLGVDKVRTSSSLDDLLAAVQTPSIQELIANIKSRRFGTADEAYEAHKPLRQALEDAGMLGYVTELIEAWYDEEDASDAD